MPVFAQRVLRNNAASNAGFTYVWLLLAVAFMAAGLAAVAELATTAMRRDKEAELLFVGDEFARAIAQYRASSSGSPQYPQRLEDLLADKRFPNVRRHLRRIYPDPMTGSTEWGLVRGPGGGIVGVYSRSTTQPLKSANFPKGYEAFASATSYADWRFVATTDGRVAASLAGMTSKGGATLAPPSVTLEPPAPRPAVRVPREPWACDAQRGNDIKTCERDVAARGEEALEACRQSAARRHRDCLAGGNAQPLAVK
jgi:type II secretory pathway pseudopilin PulG